MKFLKSIPLIFVIVCLYVFFIPGVESTFYNYLAGSIYILSFVYLFIMMKFETTGDFFLLASMISKLALIPYYILSFCAGVFTAFTGLIMPLNLFGVIGIIIIDLILFILTSAYGITGVIKSQRITKFEKIIYSILLCIYCGDVIAILIAFCRNQSVQQNKTNYRS